MNLAYIPKPYRDSDELLKMRNNVVTTVNQSDVEDPHSLYSDREIARLAETAYQSVSAPSASEALFMFMAWLTTRTAPDLRPLIVTLSCEHDAAVAADLVDVFCVTNHLPEPRPGWEKILQHPQH